MIKLNFMSSHMQQAYWPKNLTEQECGDQSTTWTDTNAREIITPVITSILTTDLSTKEHN